MLPDVLRDGLDVVFCGTAAGTRSAALRRYYAGRGNRFWRILFTVGLTPRQLDPSEYELLLSYGIGLTDIVKSQSGADRGIHFDETGPQGLRRKVEQVSPRFLCFNGKRAAKEFSGRSKVEFGLQPETIGSTSLFVAPSTSGAAAASWDPALWHELAGKVRGKAA